MQQSPSIMKSKPQEVEKNIRRRQICLNHHHKFEETSETKTNEKRQTPLLKFQIQMESDTREKLFQNTNEEINKVLSEDEGEPQARQKPRHRAVNSKWTNGNQD